MKQKFSNFAVYLLAGLLILGVPRLLWASMSSTSFVITSDDISAGGGSSSSDSFSSLSDIGGTAAGEGMASSSYAACAGYPCTILSGGAPTASISFSVTPNSVALGTLSTSSVASGNTTLTVTTTAANGYAVTAVADGHLRNADGAYIPDIADGSVTAGAGEYGIGLTGSDRAFADDRSVTTSARVVMSNAGAVSESSVTASFKAAASATTAGGAYSQIVTFVCTGSF